MESENHEKINNEGNEAEQRPSVAGHGDSVAGDEVTKSAKKKTAEKVVCSQEVKYWVINFISGKM